jgi:hypothetical protein
MRVLHAQTLGFAVHQHHEVRLSAAYGLCQHEGCIVAGLDDQTMKQLQMVDHNQAVKA